MPKYFIYETQQGAFLSLEINTLDYGNSIELPFERK